GPVASRPPPRRRPGKADAATAGAAADRGTAGHRGAARSRRSGRHADDGAEDLPALSPGTAGFHPHVRAGAGHGTIIRSPSAHRRPLLPPRAPARHRAPLFPPAPMPVTVTQTPHIAIPNALPPASIWRPKASSRRHRPAISALAAECLA